MLRALNLSPWARSGPAPVQNQSTRLYCSDVRFRSLSEIGSRLPRVSGFCARPAR